MSGIRAEKLVDMFVAGSRRLAEFKSSVDEMNVFPVPDGDTGSNMSRTLEKMEGALAGDFESPKEVAEAAARGALLGARGNSGVILSQILKGFSQGAWSGLEMGAASLASAIMEASEMAYQAVIKPVEGTILTVIKEAAQAAALSVSAPDTPVEEVMGAALLQARRTLKRTPEMMEKLRQAGVVDAGGQGLVYFLEGMMMALQGDVRHAPAMAAVADQRLLTDEQLQFRYCTEVVIAAGEEFARELRERLAPNSESLIVIGDAGVVKLHAHTADPGAVISLSMKGGELLDIKVDNMAHQHREILSAEIENANGGNGSGKLREKKDLAVVAVAAGDGINEIFMSLGVSKVVEGGQSMNPSVGEIAEALAGVEADHVVVLPGNSNVILAAEQAAAATSGKTIHVLPTKNAPQGIAAMLEFESAGGPEERAARMRKAAGSVRVGEITRAVRDADIDGLKVSDGDFISIIDGKLLFAEKLLETALRHTIGYLEEMDCELISTYRGADVSEAEAGELLEKMQSEFSALEIETHYGGQPGYHFIVSGE